MMRKLEHTYFLKEKSEDGPQIGSAHFEKYTVRFTVCMYQNLYTTLWAVTPHNKRPFHGPTTTVSVALVVCVRKLSTGGRRERDLCLWAVTPHNKRPFHRPTTTVSVALVVYVHCYCVYRPFVPRLFSEIQITTHTAGLVSK